SGFQERRCERGVARRRIVEHPQQRRGSASRTLRQPRDIDVIGASVFKRQPHEFAAALDSWPIVELVFHGGQSSSGTAWGVSAAFTSPLRNEGRLRGMAVALVAASPAVSRPALRARSLSLRLSERRGG